MAILRSSSILSREVVVTLHSGFKPLKLEIRVCLMDNYSSNVEYLHGPLGIQKGSQTFSSNTAFSSSACKLNVHKRCHKNVANNCGVNSKEMADVLKGMGLTGNKLSESMRAKKV